MVVQRFVGSALINIPPLNSIQGSTFPGGRGHMPLDFAVGS